MKFLTLAVLLTTILSSTANASALSTKKIGKSIANVGGLALGTSASPSIFAAALLECLTTSDGDTKGYACAGALMTAPVSSTVLLLVLKEDIQNVEADAYNSLAGEEISLALEEQIAKMRESFPALAEESDEFVIASMLELQSML